MNKVSLEGLEFYAYHGYYEAERKLGNKYAVDVSVLTSFEMAARTDDLSKTVDYERLYSIVKEEMSIPSKLLEHIAARINQKILAHFPIAEESTVTIHKFNPPLGGICKSATICMRMGRDEIQ